jgi:hypothetical protein
MSQEQFQRKRRTASSLPADLPLETASRTDGAPKRGMKVVPRIVSNT